jgi:hypothetical protein
MVAFIRTTAVVSCMVVFSIPLSCISRLSISSRHIVNAHKPMPAQGKTSYKTVDGAEPQPPVGGWKAVSAKSLHGQYLVDLIRQGQVTRVSGIECDHVFV